MAVGRVKTWIAGEVLTASDLNAEFNNILNNAADLANPLTKALDMNGFELILDADADSSITADTDDRIDFRAAGVDLFRMDGTTATPVNGFDFVAAAAGSEPSITAQGSDTDISVTLTPKGAGTCALAGPTVLSGALTLGGVVTTNSHAVNFSEGSAVASAATTDIWATDGNTLHVTGTTTITSLGTAPNAGAERWIVFDGALTLTHGANLNLPGSANITTAAGDFARVYADTTTQLDLQYFKSDGTAVVSSAAITLGTETASTSGTEIDFTGIPAGVTRITVMFDDVSTSGTDEIIIQLGDSGGFETSLYVGQVIEGGSSGSMSNGFDITPAAVAAATYIGQGTITRQNTSHKWVYSGLFARKTSGNQMNISAGNKTLSAELTQVRITTSGGTDTFDAGNINIAYE